MGFDRGSWPGHGAGMNARFIATPRSVNGRSIVFEGVRRAGAGIARNPDFSLEYEIPPGDDFFDLVSMSQDLGRLIGQPHIFTVANGRITTLERV